MQELNDLRKKEAVSALIGRSTVSCILVFSTQFSLSLVPRFFFASPLLLQLALSVVVLLLVLGFGRWCKRLLGVYASAPAFVFCSTVFIWLVYFLFVRQAIPHFIDVVFNGEVAMLLVGLCSILLSDPGLVTAGSLHSGKHDEIKAFQVEAQNEGSLALKRIRYCKSCEAYVKGFDHHCPAFGNCIGQNNHVLFIFLLLGFLITEATYIMCSFQCARGSQMLGGSRFEVGHSLLSLQPRIGLARSFVISTLLFTVLQVLWQGLFMAWHVYCICFNIKTDEWINWRKYPEFQINIQSQSGGSFSTMRFTNPYDKGIIRNVKGVFNSKRLIGLVKIFLATIAWLLTFLTLLKILYLSQNDSFIR